MRYVPWGEVGGRPHVVVDGPPSPHAALVLSHWHGSGTPEELLDDLSTQIVFRYLDRPDLHVEADIVTNDHFDEDGLSGMYALVEPEAALQARALLCDVAAAGDFGTYSSREAVRIAIAIQGFYDEARSPMDAAIFTAPYEEQTAILYAELLPRMAELLASPERFKALWEEEDARLARDEQLLATGAITITEQPDIDLAVVRAAVVPHEIAINNATQRHRIMTITDAAVEVRYRYETWVRYVSRPVMPRVDLTPLAEQLSAVEPAGSAWTFDGVERIYPRLRANEGSGLTPDVVAAEVEAFLRSA